MPDPVTWSILEFVGLIAGSVVVISALIKIGIWVGSTNSDINSFKKLTEKIVEKLDEVLGLLRPGPNPQIITRGSPLHLNKLGNEIAEAIKPDTWADTFEETAKSRLSENPSSYEIQETCFEYAQRELLNEMEAIQPEMEWERRLGNVAFDKGVSLNIVLQVAGYVLRNRILKSYGMEAPE